MGWYNETRCTDSRQNNPGRFLRKIIDGEKLQKQYHNQVPIKEIATFFNCSIPTIKRHLRLLISPKLRRYKFYYSESNPINQQIIKLYTNHHYSTLKIGGIVGLNDETVRKRLQRMNIQLRGHDYKNLETFHPSKLNHRSKHQYPVTDLIEFNQKFIDYYCLMLPIYKIAELLKIDRGTVSRRIKFLRTLYYFKTRFCKRCNNLYRFRATKWQRNSSICGRCRLNQYMIIA